MASSRLNTQWNLEYIIHNAAGASFNSNMHTAVLILISILLSADEDGPD